MFSRHPQGSWLLQKPMKDGMIINAMDNVLLVEDSDDMVEEPLKEEDETEEDDDEDEDNEDEKEDEEEKDDDTEETI